MVFLSLFPKEDVQAKRKEGILSSFKQAPLSMEFSREEYWSGLPYPPPGDLPNPWIKESCVSCIDKQILYQLCHMWNMALFLNYKQKCCILQTVPMSLADITGGLGM